MIFTSDEEETPPYSQIALIAIASYTRFMKICIDKYYK